MLIWHYLLVIEIPLPSSIQQLPPLYQQINKQYAEDKKMMLFTGKSTTVALTK